MNLKDQRYSQFALVREMLETPSLIASFRHADLTRPIASLRATGKLFLSGEGSSRIFPANHARTHTLRNGMPITIQTEGCRQSLEADLRGFTLFGASNSGKTKEVIALLRERRAASQFGLTATPDAPMKQHCDETFVLQCGKEDAVAATKSVIEQGLFYHALLQQTAGSPIPAAALASLSSAARTVLEQPIDPALVHRIATAPVIYFSGRNDGVAEEATLKTNEITRKKSAYLEGMYAVHGIEEVMDAADVVIVVDPFPEEEEKIKQVLVDGVGLTVIAVSARPTLFPTVRIPSVAGFDAYLQLLACWNLLVEVGITLGINLDKPTRARKIGNEYVAPGNGGH